jgi:lipoprotein-anchoring transpeptidase ErfK/SrfK
VGAPQTALVPEPLRNQMNTSARERDVVRQKTRRRGVLRGLSIVAVACALATPAAPSALAAGEATAAPSPAPVAAHLSNLHTFSQWAYPTAAALARTAPSARARVVGALRFLTSDDQAELYVALASSTLASGQQWIQVELPGRPNGQTGWVPRAALGSLHAVHGYLLVNRSTLRATLFRDGRAVFSAPVGVGKASTQTPPGRFYVLEKLRSLGSAVYGPFAIGTSAYAPTLNEWPGGGVVGIHGTNEPQLVPGRPSHGCIRMHNSDIARLWGLIQVGTPIEIV